MHHRADGRPPDDRVAQCQHLGRAVVSGAALRAVLDRIPVERRRARLEGPRQRVTRVRVR